MKLFYLFLGFYTGATFIATVTLLLRGRLKW